MKDNERLYIKNYRLNAVSSKNDVNLNSIFIPGGPGLGSEYLDSFARNLNLPGQTYLADFPGDGSNRLSQYQITWEKWKSGLLGVVNYFSPCVLITHSFGGMVALSIPELEDKLTGIVLMNTLPGPDSSLTQHTSLDQLILSDELEIRDEYTNNPNDGTFKKVVNLYKKNFFLPEEMERGEELLSKCSINSESYQWACHHFLPLYEMKWIPQKIPCLVITSEYDHFCPPQLFSTNTAFNNSENIHLVMIKNAGHFPWINYFDEVRKKFKQFYHDMGY